MNVQINKTKSLLFTKLSSFLITLTLVSSSLSAEPWIDTSDRWLRADIEMLSDIGIITVPITTYPLMWSGIAKDFDSTEIDDVPQAYKEAFWRVKKKLKQAFKKQNFDSWKVSASNSSQVLRDFGDSNREKAEVSARRYGMSKNWAWNLNAAAVANPADGDKLRLDGSYVAAVIGNWNISAGYVERWWGPSWDSTNLVSNNARPTPALMLQRNYSLPFDYDWLKWIGPWTLNTFIGVLDDNRKVKNANLIGMSITFKPFDSLEIGLRRSAQWGGDGRPEEIRSFLNLLVGRDNCGSDGISCDLLDNEPGNQLAGIDVRWRLPLETPTSLYFSAIGEDEAGYLPAKNIFQFGLTSVFVVNQTPWKWYLELSDTAVFQDTFNITYEHHIYQTGYRYNGKSIGSTFDNDSTVMALGILGRLDAYSSVMIKYSNIELNRDGPDTYGIKFHSITALPKKMNSFKVSWQQDFTNRGVLKLNVTYFSDKFDEFNRQEEKYRIGADWTYPLN